MQDYLKKKFEQIFDQFDNLQLINQQKFEHKILENDK